MAQFKSDTILMYFLKIFLTINIAHADLKDDDVKECLRQIKIAYGNNDSSTGCFKYAVQYYKKGDYISVDESLIPSTSDQGQNIADLQNNVQCSNEETYSEQEDINYLEDLSLYVDNFEGLQDFIKKDIQKNNQSLDQQSSQQEDFNNNIQHFDEQINNERESAKYLEGSFKGLQDLVKKDELQYAPCNYAMAYYTALENMVQGNNIFAPLSFCLKFCRNDPKCKKALKIFGRTPKSAVGVALTLFNLSECVNYPYIHKYMKYIIRDLKIISPSKNPVHFCLEIYSDKDWYLQLKRNK